MLLVWFLAIPCTRVGLPRNNVSPPIISVSLSKPINDFTEFNSCFLISNIPPDPNCATIKPYTVVATDNANPTGKNLLAAPINCVDAAP